MNSGQSAVVSLSTPGRDGNPDADAFRSGGQRRLSWLALQHASRINRGITHRGWATPGLNGRRTRDATTDEPASSSHPAATADDRCRRRVFNYRRNPSTAVSTRLLANLSSQLVRCTYLKGVYALDHSSDCRLIAKDCGKSLFLLNVKFCGGKSERK